MAQNRDRKVIGYEELKFYDSLLKQYINFTIPAAQSSQIDELFPTNPTEPTDPDPIIPDNPDPQQPEELPHVSFAYATEEQFINIINGYYNNIYTLEQIRSIWYIGETRTIDISSMPVEYVGESHRAQTVTIRIIDFDHDELTTPINNKTKALLTVDLVNCLRAEGISDDEGSINSENGYMTPANSSERGWKASARRKWCNDTFYNALPNYIKYLVKTVNKNSYTFVSTYLPPLGEEGVIINQNTHDITEDKVFLLAPVEMLYRNESTGLDSHISFSDGSPYQYFYEDNGYRRSKFKLPRWDSTESTCIYWTRSMELVSPSQEFVVMGNFPGGYWYKGFAAESNYGIAPAFCL